MAYVNDPLTNSGLARLASAIKAQETRDGAAAVAYSLPVEELAILTDKLNINNPLLAYSAGLPIAATGAGSIELKWVDGADNWKPKTEHGESSYDDIEIERETLYWNKPLKRAEAMLAFDLSKGVPNVLATRATHDLIKFTQASIKAGFVKLGGTAGLPVAEYTATGTSVQEKGAQLLLSITQAATAMVKDTQLDKGDLTITIAPERFDELALAGLIGDRSNVTFTGGQYSVGLVSGYKIQSGEMFLPDKIGVATAGDVTGSDTQENLVAVIGTSSAIAHNIDVIAMNAGQIDLTNDQGTYVEAVDITAVPKHVVTKGFVKFVVAK